MASKMTPDFIHLGDACAPGIIIQELLNIKTKQLFQLGGYYFNDILEFLKIDQYESIIEKTFLLNQYNENQQFSEFADEDDKHYHGHPVLHSKFNFIFNHDFLVQNKTKIVNYGFIVREFEEKIRRFRASLIGDNVAIFITFTNNKNARIEEMISFLKTITKKPFYVLLYTNEQDLTNQSSENVYKCFLDEPFFCWSKPMKDRESLYRKIYYYLCLFAKEKQLSATIFPVFEQTHYFKTYCTN